MTSLPFDLSFSYYCVLNFQHKKEFHKITEDSFYTTLNDIVSRLLKSNITAKQEIIDELNKELLYVKILLIPAKETTDIYYKNGFTEIEINDDYFSMMIDDNDKVRHLFYSLLFNNTTTDYSTINLISNNLIPKTKEEALTPTVFYDCAKAVANTLHNTKKTSKEIKNFFTSYTGNGQLCKECEIFNYYYKFFGYPLKKCIMTSINLIVSSLIFVPFITFHLKTYLTSITVFLDIYLPLLNKPEK